MNFGFVRLDPNLVNGPTMTMLVVDFVIVFAVLVLVRAIYSAASGVSMSEEVASKDNFAVGISLAGATAGIGIMLTGVASGGFAATFNAEVRGMIAYAAIGLVLMWLTRIVFDRVALPRLSVREEVEQGNIGVAVVEAGNLLATAIMVRAVMVWSEDALVPGMIAVLTGWVVSQIILTLTAYYRILLFRSRNDGARFDETVQGGNLALALRFVGFQIGVALAVTAATGLTPYQPGVSPIMQAAGWGLVSLVMAVILIALALLAERFVLRGIDVSDEVDGQRNIGVALIEVAVYVALGLLLMTHLT